MAKMRNPISLPAGGASQANVDKSLSQATDEIKEVVYKSVAGLEVELNKTASATANGTLVIEPSDGKDVMEKATVTVAIPLEDNKAATIDVSQYASAVEVTPTDGKTAMKKTTVTLSNIPVLESNKAATIDVSQYSEAVEVTPSSNKDAMEKATVTLTNIPDIEANKEASITQNGTVEITPSSGKDAMAKTTVTVNVSGGGADLEDNKEATIDVSAYTDPVEITPTQGKDGMKKVTVSLSNMPAGANMLYSWYDTEGNVTIYTQSATPSVDDPVLYYNQVQHKLEIDPEYPVEAYDSNTDTITWDSTPYSRDSQSDVEIWNAPPEVETTKQATIDVSTYDPSNKPVITPTAGKQSMGSVEITLDNIPSPSGSLTFYAWGEDTNAYGWTLSETPQIGDTYYPCGYDYDSIRTNPQYLRTIVSIGEEGGEPYIEVPNSDPEDPPTRIFRISEGDITFPITPTP